MSPGLSKYNGTDDYDGDIVNTGSDKVPQIVTEETSNDSRLESQCYYMRQTRRQSNQKKAQEL